jgi:putative glycerol-1-phosphate prenyltransferase
MLFAGFHELFPSGLRHLVLLIDPDTFEFNHYADILHRGRGVFSAVFLGGSHITEGNTSDTLKAVRSLTDVPVILFPGSVMQIVEGADALLFISLLSGRNPELLIGQHVLAAPKIRSLKIPVIPTAYILINSGAPTTASYISNTQPIPSNKPAIAAATALAGALLGFKAVYLDGGSGSDSEVPVASIAAVRKAVSLPLICGGGIRSVRAVQTAFDAGADVVVIGNALEQSAVLLNELMEGIWQK